MYRKPDCYHFFNFFQNLLYYSSTELWVCKGYIVFGKRHYYEPLLMTLQRVGDALIGTCLFLGAGWFFNDYTQYIILSSIVIFLLSIVFFTYSGIYRSWRVGKLLDEINQLIIICIFIFLILFALAYFLKVSNLFSRKAIITWMVLWPSLLAIQRVIIRSFLRYFRKKGRNLKTAVFVGYGKLGEKITSWIEENPWSGTQIKGIFNDDNKMPVKGYPILGTLDKFSEYVKNNKIDIVYILFPFFQREQIQEVIKILSDSTSSIYLIPDVTYFDYINNVEISYIGDIPVISIMDSQIKGIHALIKRLEDIVLSSIILMLVTPVIIAISIGVKLTSKGPVLFKQWRYGLNGKLIKIWKFRTMTVCEDGYNFKQATKSDPRITKIGAFLRKANLDELPQFFNVIQGKMSIVGPRPHAVAMNEKYRKMVGGYMLRHKIKPGITGLAQVNGWRGEIDTLEKMEKRLQYDLEYFRQWSLLLDLKIIFLTLLKGFKGQNAY